MSSQTFLTDHFLIAMPQLADPNFFHTVTYICEHNADGALGIVINRPLEIKLGEILGHMGIAVAAEGVAGQTVFNGGPVQQERGFVLHRPVGSWASSLRITEEIAVTTSKDVLMALAEGEGPAEYLIALGYAGWGAGQLEREMGENAWLSGPADPGILFHGSVERRWERAAALLGVDLRLLSMEAGHG